MISYLQALKLIEKNCKNVGENFTREARSIHYDNFISIPKLQYPCNQFLL